LFDGRLPTYRLTWADPPVAGWLGECTPAKRLIRLRRGLSGEALRATLLHEMIHAAGPMGHGQHFQTKLAHLARQGERWALEELAYYRHHHPTWPQLQRRLKALLEEQAQAQPRPSVVAMRRMAADLLACRPSEVPRKVPWLEASWRQACAQVDQARQK
jgi:hypothetical protein